MGKVLIVTNHSYMLYRFRKELIERLQQDYEVVVSTPFVGHEENLKAMGCKCIETDVDRRGVNPKTDLKLMDRYRKILDTEKPDFVITYSIKPNIYMGMLCWLKHIPYYVNVQGLGTAFQEPQMAEIVTILYRVALTGVRTVFFENDSNAQEFVQRHIVPQEKIAVLPGAGINLNSYAYSPYPKNAARHFLYLGRIMKEKGMDEWFEAAVRLKKEYGDRVVFDIVGFFEDEYKELVEKLQKEQVIEFHGFDTEPRPYYKMCNCVVLPSYHEGLSNVLLEAAAMGRPVLTSDIPGCREAVVDRETGYLCKAKDAEDLYQKMKIIVESTDGELEEMGRRARFHVKQYFDKKIVVEQTVSKLHA